MPGIGPRPVTCDGFSDPSGAQADRLRTRRGRGVLHLDVFRSLLRDDGEVLADLEQKLLVFPQIQPRLNRLQELITKSPEHMVRLMWIAIGH